MNEIRWTGTAEEEEEEGCVFVCIPHSQSIPCIISNGNDEKGKREKKKIFFSVAIALKNNKL